MSENNKPKIEKTLPVGHYIDEQLPVTWSEKDLALLKRKDYPSPGKTEESPATESPDENEEVMENRVKLTPRFTQAVDYACHVHVELRKGTQVPYMAHLLGVASLVLGESGHIPFQVTEDMVIAALLHDAVEDEGGLPRLRDIEANFGKAVAKIVEGCTDSFEEDANRKQEWEVRKASYIERLWNEPPATLLVSIADKLYNARAILEDYKQLGAEVWTRFKRGREQQLWYFDELLKVYKARCPDWRIVEELKQTVKELAKLCSGETGLICS